MKKKKTVNRLKDVVGIHYSSENGWNQILGKSLEERAVWKGCEFSKQDEEKEEL